MKGALLVTVALTLSFARVDAVIKCTTSLAGVSGTMDDTEESDLFLTTWMNAFNEIWMYKPGMCQVSGAIVQSQLYKGKGEGRSSSNRVETFLDVTCVDGPSATLPGDSDSENSNAWQKFARDFTKALIKTGHEGFTDLRTIDIDCDSTGSTYLYNYRRDSTYYFVKQQE